MTIQNNVTRFLTSKNIEFSVFESEAVKRSAIETAEMYHLDEETVFKTIVVLRMEKGKPLLILVPACYEVNPKKTAVAINEKKVKVSTQAEAEKITGLLSGGISPLALVNRGFQVLIHKTAMDHEKISISGGQRGLSILIKPADLIQLVNAKTADVADKAEKRHA